MRHTRPYPSVSHVCSHLCAHLATSYWSISDIFEEEGLPTINASFAGNFGLITPFGVPKPAYRLLQLLHGMGDTRLPLNITPPAGPCADTVGGLASRNATHVLALLYSQASTHSRARRRHSSARLP